MILKTKKHCLDVKVTVYLQVEHFKNGASWGQSYYRTLIGNYIQSIKLYCLQ